MLKSFLSDRAGNFGIITGVATLPLLLSVGFAVDYSRYLSAQSHLQELADVASLTLASSREENKKKLEAIADDFIAANIGASKFNAVEIADLNTDNNQIDLELKSGINTYFMGLANIDRLDVRASALAERAVTGSVEVALVLDNTFSMDEADPTSGVKKIASLKTAANALVTELMSNPDASVKIGLVPYADYVNVGTKYRNESWLSVPADYTVPAVPKSGCSIQSVTTTPCATRAPSYQCTSYYDGVPVTSTCTGACILYGDPVTTQKEVCDTPAVAAKTYKWYGCIGSRKTGTYRLDDTAPTVTYPGYLDTSQKCLNPIVALSTDKAALKTAIASMIINIGGYRPYTYIPAGLVWGINVLSPTAPLAEAAAYDPANRTPRKALLLMTDGENTRSFRSSDGKHVAFSTAAATAATQLATVNKETVTLCTYAKSKNIEVYSVAFMVDDAAAKTMLEACATDSDHYFDASDPEALLAAFSGIAQSLSQVRLAR